MIHSLFKSKKDPHGTVVVTKKLSYDRDKVLGSGSYGTVVYQGQFEDRPVAVKKMMRRQQEIVDREVFMLLKTDSHQNIVRFVFDKIFWAHQCITTNFSDIFAQNAMRIFILLLWSFVSPLWMSTLSQN